EDPANRLNPRNGLCLNALHDRIFDRGLMWIEDQFIVRLSSKLRDARRIPKITLDWFCQFDGKRLQLPPRFTPDPKFLCMHAAKHRMV
ncbi:MAG: HNH endonuclease, partial [Verrucomicrobiia bacterium]